MREMMVEICHIIVNNLENKEELLEKMKQIEEIEYKEIEVEVELNEEKTKKESKRKVQFSSENEEKTYDPADQPHKICLIIEIYIWNKVKGLIIIKIIKGLKQTKPM